MTPTSLRALPLVSSTPVAPSNANNVSLNNKAEPFDIFNKLHASTTLEKTKNNTNKTKTEKENFTV